MRNIKKQWGKIVIALLGVMLWVVAPSTTQALEINPEVNSDVAVTVDLIGAYRNPFTGVIEDSGGESNAALGESMVAGMVSDTAIYDSDSIYGSVVIYELSLVNSVSDITFSMKEQVDDEWKVLDYGREDLQDDVGTFTVPIPSPTVVLKAECFVVPMGRSVVFFITFEGDAIQSVTTTESAESVATTTTVSNDNQVLGLTIGGPDVVLAEETESVSEDVAGTMIGEQLVIDDSVWVTLFMLIFSVVVISGTVLILVYFLFKRVLLGKTKQPVHQKDVFAEVDNGLQDEVDFTEIEMWEDANEE